MYVRTLYMYVYLCMYVMYTVCRHVCATCHVYTEIPCKCKVAHFFITLQHSEQQQQQHHHHHSVLLLYILQHHLDTGIMYDRVKLVEKLVTGIRYVACLDPPAGRGIPYRPNTARLIRHFSVHLKKSSKSIMPGIPAIS